jgi:hypothetical protein
MTEATRKFPLSFTKLAFGGNGSTTNVFCPRSSNSGLQRSSGSGSPAATMKSFAAAAASGAPEHRSGDEMLPHRVMGLGQYLGKSHGDRTHRQMDRVFTQRLDDASATENDLLHRIVVGEHRDNDVALARACRAARDFRPFVPQFLGSAPSAVVGEDAMARLQEVTRHRLPHSPEANKPDFHRVSAPSSRCHCVFELSGNSGNQRLEIDRSVVPPVVDKECGRPVHATTHAAEEIAPHLIGEGAVRQSVAKPLL